ncbi:hypothetical protein Tco_0445833 [Tanacetum coccineum]
MVSIKQRPKASSFQAVWLLFFGLALGLVAFRVLALPDAFFWPLPSYLPAKNLSHERGTQALRQQVAACAKRYLGDGGTHRGGSGDRRVKPINEEEQKASEKERCEYHLAEKWGCFKLCADRTIGQRKLTSCLLQSL